jgi:hypothetical protein
MHMQKVYNKDHRLESHRFFSYAAWITVIGFAVFVYNLVVRVGEETAALEANRATIENQFLLPSNDVLDPDNG